MKNMSVRMLELAEEGHGEQIRHNGEPYVNHPKRVAAIFEDDFRKTIALGHDLGEDHPEYWPILKKEFPLEVIEALVLLTREKDQTYFEFIMKIRDSQNVAAAQCKLSDLRDNMNDLKEGSKKDKYRFAFYILSNYL